MDMTQTVPELTTFYVYLTSGCNCACRHCYFIAEDAKQGRSDEILDPEVLRRAIIQALPLGLQRLKWTGGEPTFHPAFVHFLQLQKEFSLSANLETNGLLLDQKLVELMSECGVDQVSVSLDGSTASTHDEIRGVSGGFERTLGGVRALRAVGYQPELILTLQRDNVAELDGYVSLARELGAGAVKVNVLQPFLRGASLAREGHALSVEEIVAIAEKLNVIEDFPVFIDVPLAFRSLSEIVDGDHDGVCNVLHILGILPNAEYALCGVGRHVPELAMGAVMKNSLEEVWNQSPLLLSLRDGLPKRLEGVCGDCLMKTACKGSCVAANYQGGGDLFAPYWFCQQAVRAGIFPASRLAKKPQTS